MPHEYIIIWCLCLLTHPLHKTKKKETINISQIHVRNSPLSPLPYKLPWYSCSRQGRWLATASQRDFVLRQSMRHEEEGFPSLGFPNLAIALTSDIYTKASENYNFYPIIWKHGSFNTTTLFQMFFDKPTNRSHVTSVQPRWSRSCCQGSTYPGAWMRFTR